MPIRSSGPGWRWHWLLFRMPGDSFRMPGGSFRMPDGSFRMPGGAFRIPGGSFRIPDGSFRMPGGSFRIPGGSFRIRNALAPTPASWIRGGMAAFVRATSAYRPRAVAAGLALWWYRHLPMLAHCCFTI